MRRIYITVVAFLMVLACSAVRAEETIERASTSITLKNDWHFTADGKSFDSQEYSAYLHYRNFGGGMDIDYTRRLDFLQVKSYLTWNQGPWYLVGGTSFGDCGDFVQAGGWYLNKFGKLSVLADVRNFFGLDANSKSFLDSFWEVNYPIGDKFFVGVDAVYDYWWKSSNQWAMAGPFVGYRINNVMSVFVRFTHEWDIPCSAETKEANVIRTGVIFSF